MGEFNEWETFKNFPWWGKILALVAGAPIIIISIILALISSPVFLWVWWLDRKDRKIPPHWARDK